MRVWSVAGSGWIAMRGCLWSFGGSCPDECHRVVRSGVDVSGGGGVGEEERAVLDARLLPAALSCWGVTIAVLVGGWWYGVVLAVVLGGAVGVSVSLGHRCFRGTPRWGGVAVTVVAAMALGTGFAVAAAWREHSAATHPLRDEMGKSVSVVVTPTNDPKPLGDSGFGGERRWLVKAALHHFRTGAQTVTAGGSVVVLASGADWDRIAPGQRVKFRARVDYPWNRDLTVATLRSHGAPERMGSPPWWQRGASAVRSDFETASVAALPADQAGMVRALVVGDTSGISDSVRTDFEASGLQHLTAVSGANFTILLAVVLFGVRRVALGPRATAIIAAGALLMFVVVARPDPSVLRAAAMGSITLLALASGRRRQALPALCAAVIGLLLLWPALAVSAGFALSVLATGALILIAPGWADWLRARGWWRLPAEIVAVSAAAFLVTIPIVIVIAGRVSVVAILANVLVTPVVAPITVIGALGAVCSCLWMPLAVLALRCASPPLWWLLEVAERTASLPGATVSVPGGVPGGLVAGVIVLAVIPALRNSRFRRLTATLLALYATLLIPLHLWQTGMPRLSGTPPPFGPGTHVPIAVDTSARSASHAARSASGVRVGDLSSGCVRVPTYGPGPPWHPTDRMRTSPACPLGGRRA
ncbi:competence protein ComEC [Nocardia puris]|uniref:Competence protein ComEC n=1 Tax=Nocardia puris TaxID=208602 RepID=A0A366DEA7_9NOCA|nr:competence protein ComEC [Nocardia puris]